MWDLHPQRSNKNQYSLESIRWEMDLFSKCDFPPKRDIGCIVFCRAIPNYINKGTQFYFFLLLKNMQCLSHSLTLISGFGVFFKMLIFF